MKKFKIYEIFSNFQFEFQLFSSFEIKMSRPFSQKKKIDEIFLVSTPNFRLFANYQKKFLTCFVTKKEKRIQNWTNIFQPLTQTTYSLTCVSIHFIITSR